MRLQWVDWKDENVLLDVGGVWDRREEAFVEDGDTAAIVRMQASQYEACEWFGGWLRCYLRGGARPPAYDRKWTMYCLGGRRGAKSDFAVKACVAVAVAKPGRTIFLISPTEKETAELRKVIERTVPRHWYHPSEEETIYTFANFSELVLLSGYRPTSLKRGRVDFWLLNEAQEISKVAYTKLRAPLADTGGLGIVVANPPDRPIGQWIDDIYDELKAGKKTAVMFEFDAEKNEALANVEALDDMKDDVSDDDYEREIKGNFGVGIGDRVWRSYHPKLTVKPCPDVGDVTAQFCQTMFGFPFTDLGGFDLQRDPHMAMAMARLYYDEEHPTEPFLWFRDEIVLPGQEEDVCFQLARKGYDPHTTGIVMDASAWWQDGAHTPGRKSDRVMRAEGWTHLYRPDKGAKKNPLITERVATFNARLKAASGRRRVFVDPACVHLCAALRKWEIKHGVPYRQSDWAHASDAMSYLIYRIMPRRLRRSRGIGYERIKRGQSDLERDFDKL